MTQGPQDIEWDGALITLQPGARATIPQTPNGSLIFASFNPAAAAGPAQIEITSGGSLPLHQDVGAPPALPGILVANWQANNLSVANVGAPQTPVLIEAAGPGLPGQNPTDLPVDTQVSIKPGQAMMGVTEPQFMELRLFAATSAPTIIGIVGGPADESGNNAYVIALNAPGGESGAPGYSATAASGNHDFPFNWGTVEIFVVNLSTDPTAAVNVLLVPL